VALLLLALPAVVQAQDYTYTVNNGTITITRYTGPGGDVTIPGTINGLPVRGIGDGAFFNCTNLTNVTIPNSVTSIGTSAFDSCTSLTSVTIPNSVKSIGDHAFDNLTRLTSVTIPNSVTSIGIAFVGCASLSAITVDPINTFYSSVDGVLFNKRQTTLIECPGGKLGSYTVPDSVTNIGSGALADCRSLTSVTIPNSVTSIGDYAFQLCTSLTSVAVPNSVINMGKGTFYVCTSLTNVTIPNNLTSIGDFAFSGTALVTVTVPNSVTSIGRFAFYYCTGLTNVTIPSRVTSIGDYAFSACASLSAITVAALNSFYSSIDGILFNNSRTKLICFPGGKAGSYIIPSTATSIGRNAFDGCTFLTGVTIPNSVTSIGDNAFVGCGSLTNVTLPNSVTSIGDGAFESCSSLTSVTFPNKLTRIANWAFSYCSDLNSVTVPNSVTSIGDGAFYNCNSLISVIIPSSVTNIGVQAFGFCTNLTAISVDAANACYSGVDGVLFNKSQTTLLQFPGGKFGNYVIPNSVTSIANWAFEGCTNLTSVYFQGSTPGIGSSVFDSDNNATVYYLPGTTGWGPTFGGRPTALWPPPTIQTSPRTQTAESGGAVSLWVDASSPVPLFYLWYFNAINLMSCSTNCDLQLTNVQFSQSGAYTVVVTNVSGAATSSPALLNVIAPVERRPVPAVKLTGEAGSLLNVDSADSLSSAPNWTTVGSVSLTSTSGYYFDLTLPLPPQRFFRTWQTGTPAVIPSLVMHLVPAITLTGNIGDSVRVDAINQFGPIDAWFTLDTVTLTNTSQLYFDTSAWGQPPRLYRLVQVP
jgi:hypothetical protein